MGGAWVRAWLAYGRWRLTPKTYPPAVQAVEALYRRLRRSTGFLLEVERFGAAVPPSAWGRPTQVSLAALTRRAASPPWKGRLLYGLTQARQPHRILELGTHLGLSTLYIGLAVPAAELHTVEASPTLLRYARLHARLLGLRPIFHAGTFAEVLPKLQGPWDLVYVDGDHRPEAFLAYGEALFPQLTQGGWLICDDVFWSRALYQAWEALAALPWRHRTLIGPFGLLQK
ncbi:MAG: hypothetical protein KatS3mg026_1474 [Bacteroidia bacterium]|nr:MAG: hypothetical protein KatS3mg026_1474 [Bacteroidia bacterium]